MNHRQKGASVRPFRCGTNSPPTLLSFVNFSTECRVWPALVRQLAVVDPMQNRRTRACYCEEAVDKLESTTDVNQKFLVGSQPREKASFYMRASNPGATCESPSRERGGQESAAC